MGTKMAVAFANIFMANIETQILSNSVTKPTIWKRYIDDIFSLWDVNKPDIDKFIEKANSHRPTIKFTAEISNTEKQYAILLLVRLPSAPSFRRTAKSHHLLNGSYLRKTVPQYFQRNDPKFRLWRHKPFHKTDNNSDTKAAKTAIDCNEREAFDVTTNESAGKLHAHLDETS